MQGIGQAMPAIRDGAVIEAKRLVVQVIARLLRTLLEGIATLDCKIAEAAEAHPDFFIFQSFPGAGAGLAPRLLAALGSQRDRYASAEEVQKYSGIAPVTERSGKKKWVHFRWACPKFLRQSFHEWAGHSIAHSPWARSYYQQQRERGMGHHAAVRGWPSNGFALFFVAGKIGWLMTRADIWRRSPNETHRSLRLPLGQSCEIFVDTL